jgi:chorismate dehydratase
MNDATIIQLQPVVRLGAIAFINTLPIYSLLPPSPAIQLVYGPPTQLNADLLSGGLDISPVSSAFYLQNEKHLTLLPGLSVSSFGSVNSVLVLSHCPLSSVTTIAIPNDSATSVALLRLFCLDLMGYCPTMVVYPADELDTILVQHTTALVIGDRALAASTAPPTRYVFDLSDWWVEKTGLPVVFAVWAANTAWLEQNKAGTCQDIVDALCHSRDTFFANSEWLQRQVLLIAKKTNLPVTTVDHYFTQSLDYGWSEAHVASLKLLKTGLACSSNNALMVN